MSLFSQPIQKSVIEQAIADLEKKTSAELRVYVERKKRMLVEAHCSRQHFYFSSWKWKKRHYATAC